MSESNAPVYVRVGDENGQVVVLFTKDPEGSFPSNISQWRTDPAECLEIINAMERSAFIADPNAKTGKRILKASDADVALTRLLPRFTVMLSSLRRDSLKSDGQMAMALLQVALKEIF